MTPKQLFEACTALAPNFRVCVEYTTMPTNQRVLAWHGRLPDELFERTSALPFQDNRSFEVVFFEVLKTAYATLQNP